MNSLYIGPLDASHQARVCDILCQAFAQDPAYEYFLQDSQSTHKERHREQLIRFIVAYHLGAGKKLWGVEQQGRLVACALVEPPTSFLQDVKSLCRHLPTLFGKVPWQSILRMNRYAQVSRHGVPYRNAYYLVKIGVYEQYQGQGYGRQLIEALLDECRRQETSLALDTENPANVPLYQHLGFELHDECQLDQLTIFRMHHPFKE